MTWVNEIKYRMLIAFTSLMSAYNRVRITLGLLEVKYGMPGYFDHKGSPHIATMHSKKRLLAAEQYDNFRPDDILLLTYPKAGTHFTRDIMTSIFEEKGITPSHVTLEASLPSFTLKNLNKEATGPLETLERGVSPRIIMTHWSWNFLPTKVKEGKVKVVHCTRNPKDVMCSMFPFFSTVGILAPGTTWTEFFNNFVEGNVLNGNYFTHLKEWYPNRDSSSILTLQFEDMKQGLEENVRRIAQFLELELTQEEVDRVVKANTFANKKKEMGSMNPMYRQGKSGGWRSQLTVEQNAVADEWIQREMEGMDEFQLKFE